MGALEHHNIDDILRTHNVSLPAEVVEALATAFRSVLLAEDDAVEERSRTSGKETRVAPPEVYTVDALSIRPVVNGEAQPCLRALIHGHFMRTYYGRGQAAARKAHQATDAYLAAVAVEPPRVRSSETVAPVKAPSPAVSRKPHSWYTDIGAERRYAREPEVIVKRGKVVADVSTWHPLYEDSPQAGTAVVEEGSDGVQRGLACAADMCQTYADSADNYQKRLAAFHCVKRIREAIAAFTAVDAVRAKVLDKVCTPRAAESAMFAG